MSLAALLGSARKFVLGKRAKVWPLAADFLVHHVGRVTSASTPSTSATRRDGSNPQGYEPEKKRKRSDSCNLALPECLGLSKKPASLWASPK
ncbi:hypothetical protein EV361DRAFT_949074 [Lentinula raphanica]|nr:hypothetical protein EV361DRAFT_949074 [Lentinula raphanica]